MKFMFKPRDFKILEYMSTQNFATGKELHKRFFIGKKSNNYHLKRLRKLQEAGFIEKILGAEAYILGYILTEKAIKKLNKADFKVLPHTTKKDRFKHKYDHDILVNKIKNKLLTSPLVSNFIPEQQLVGKFLRSSKIRSEFTKGDKIPDGLFTLSIRGKSETIALEVELNAKSKQRYESIFLKHLLTDNWGVVFYMVKDEALRNILMSNLKQIREENILLRDTGKTNSIYFCLVNEFLNQSLTTLFIDEQVEFSLKRLEKINTENKEVS